MSLFFSGTSMKTNERRPSESFVTGVVVIIVLIMICQTAMFVHRAAVMRIAANRDEPDTVYVYESASASAPRKDASGKSSVRKNAIHSPRAEIVRQNVPRKRVESFRFNPNTASKETFCRLGFSPKQAESIVAYRLKGGRFHRREDFAKSFVVSDSIYRRLQPYIDIPCLDLNLADSADFDALPGIGGWFAARMIAHREALGGYSYKEQLMDIWKFDRQKYDALSDLVVVDPCNVTPYPLWTYPVDSLRRHPYIRNYETARAIVLFRETSPRTEWTIQKLSAAGILSESAAERLSRCILDLP